MSLDITSHPGRPGLDELVPSRYALNVGAIDVMVISDGVLPLPGAMLGHNADPAVRAAWLEDKFLPPDGFDWALNAVVVRSGGRTILIDAGLGSDPDLNLPRAGRLVQRLEAAGIDLASVTDVVLTLSLSEIKSGRIHGANLRGVGLARYGQRPAQHATLVHPCSAIGACERHCNIFGTIPAGGEDAARRRQRHGQGNPVGSNR